MQLAIPVVPTVRVVITFTKFVELQPVEAFYTPFSSPRHFNGNGESSSDNYYTDGNCSTSASSSRFSRSGSRSSSTSKRLQQESKSSGAQGQQTDPFAIPTGYRWSSFDEKSKKMTKSKSSAKKK